MSPRNDSPNDATSNASPVPNPSQADANTPPSSTAIATPTHTPSTAQDLAAHIARLQTADGLIPWGNTGIWDPWNHCEAAMGLSVMGDHARTDRALNALIESQHTDGHWLADMGCAAPMDAANERLDTSQTPTIIDPNFCAYPGLFVWHTALVRDDTAPLHRAFPMLDRAMDWLVAQQRSDGAFPWRAIEAGENPQTIDALAAGNASIALSLACTIQIFQVLERPSDHIHRALSGILTAFNAPDRAPDRDPFVPKPHHAMDWYYPVLTGLVTGPAARLRLASRWGEFVHPHWGCRCMSDHPWATAAETAELAIASMRAGDAASAKTLLAATLRHRDPEHGLWMGHQFAEHRPWPLESPSWTAGAALLAMDAIDQRTKAAQIFTHFTPASVRGAR